MYPDPPPPKLFLSPDVNNINIKPLIIVEGAYEVKVLLSHFQDKDFNQSNQGNKFWDCLGAIILIVGTQK